MPMNAAGMSAAQWGPTLAASFLASLVECVEALTVVLAVGSVRGWRSALAGCAAALALLAVIVAAAGPAIARIPLDLARVAIGTLLLLFGLRWLRKAILRAGGLIPLRDEAAAYRRAHEAASAPGAAAGPDRVVRRWDAVALAAAFNITMLEGAEVVFIVVAIGAGGSGLLGPAAAGAGAALAAVALLGVLLHRPLVRVPENLLKFAVGVLLSAFGTFWVGEGLGLGWPGGDLSIPGLILGYCAVGGLAAGLGRARAGRRVRVSERAT